ncbi:ANL_collapsed_G0003370.mRNA.1.CDS.1 [Saccharomyces cerevisiae]|nr:AVN_HP_G0137560.mRNA.1.CDS.1 [Saccharomyces cerevisiae]CAI4929926.1 AVN_HP_G0141600.mRNA.1.CDS.1 [Saccharomyces cerevisiae]CAI4935177.1 BEM_HP_G0133800.mRNA.1.CDS.1 [Saccharomyces cerevisiae]CAI4937791.1 AVN_HP_G0146830.mRNA.1.CDS.1 [Saccharomyces cerevisiae]CAI4941244.1 AVN_HP_G0149330.mRNA.1.CDS.1 [Saccharomyces cerevisiae]
MSFRHFKRRLDTSSADESSSADEEHPDQNVSLTEKSASLSHSDLGGEILNGTGKNRTPNDGQESNESDGSPESDESPESEESSDNSDSSDSDDMRPLPRPLFMKKKANNLQKATKIDQPWNTQDDARVLQTKKENMIKNIDKANQVAKNYETMKLRLNTNYSTNEELIKQCMLLDDNDEVDSEKERQKWFERQNERKQKHRRIQLAKQRESEEYEAKRFEAMRKGKDGNTKYDVILDKEKEKLDHKKQRSAEKVEKSHNNNRYKITRTKNVEFGDLGKNSRDYEETEYSVI